MDIKKRYSDYKLAIDYHFNRSRASKIALEKINKLKLLVAPADDIQQIERKHARVMIASMMGIFTFSHYGSKRWLGKFMLSGFGILMLKLSVSTHYESEIVECIAEKPTEAGQAVRAVFMFKMPNHVKRSHYEALSSEYREYLRVKNSEL